MVLAWHGGLVADLTAQVIDEFDTALSASSIPPSSRRAYRARLASLRQLLYETRVVDTAPRWRRSARSLEQRFTEVAMADPIRETLLRYIRVRAAVLRPKSVESLINDLLPFAEYLTAHHPRADQPARAGPRLHRGLPGVEPHPRLARATRRRRRRSHRLGRGGAVGGAEPAQPARRHHRLGLGSRRRHGGWSSPPTSPNSTSRCPAH